MSVHSHPGNDGSVPPHSTGAVRTLVRACGSATPPPTEAGTDPAPPAHSLGSASALAAAGAAVVQHADSSQSEKHLLAVAGSSTQLVPGSLSAHKFGAALVSHPLYGAYVDDGTDDMHEPDIKDQNHGISWMGALNVVSLTLLILAVLMLFAGYPIYSEYSKQPDWAERATGRAGGTNGSGQVPNLPLRPLIDPDTPSSARKWTNLENEAFDIVFSDEFNQEGRTFWPGDDPFWEAMDLYYAATNDYEWYSPEAVNTTGGSLVLTLTQKDTHNLNFQSGMVQSWNKFCFQGGYLEFSIQFPAFPYSQGYWPAAWMMGNLARPGYLGSTDGMWPYSYSSCDTGILPNQTFLNQSGPYEALHSQGQWAKNGVLSYLNGMRASSCTCPGEDHPGPNMSVGRAAPEIDVLEAQVQQGRQNRNEYHTFASESLQTAPFDVGYWWRNTSEYATIYNDSVSRINDYHGSVYQEAVSGLTQCPDEGFELTAGKYIRYGVEYLPDWNLDGGGYVRWWMDGKPAWQVQGTALAPVAELDIGQRHIPVEPMTIIMNLGISPGFQQTILNPDDVRGLRFPAQLKFDYVRLYQPEGQTPRVSCDPPDYPTTAYIARNPHIFYNPNFTTYPHAWPKNKITHPGC